MVISYVANDKRVYNFFIKFIFIIPLVPFHIVRELHTNTQLSAFGQISAIEIRASLRFLIEHSHRSFKSFDDEYIPMHNFIDPINIENGYEKSLSEIDTTRSQTISSTQA